jgi:hypothetical protein
MWHVPVKPNMCENSVCPRGYKCEERANICYSSLQFAEWLKRANLLSSFAKFVRQKDMPSLLPYLTPLSILQFMQAEEKNPDFAAPSEFYEMLEQGIGSPEIFDATRTLNDLKTGASYPPKELFVQPLSSLYSEGKRWVKMDKALQKFLAGHLMAIQKREAERRQAKASRHIGIKRGGEPFEQPGKKALLSRSLS